MQVGCGGVGGEVDRNKGISGECESEFKTGHRRKGGNFANSAFVTDGALLGIKSVGSDAEHVVALDADAVDDGTYDGAGLGGFGQANRGRSGSFLNGAFVGHGRILAWRGLSSIEA
jgi:hypothetical protein